MEQTDPPLIFWFVLVFGWISALCWVSGAIMLLRRQWLLRKGGDDARENPDDDLGEAGGRQRGS
jgi:hypothetical protein